MRTEEIWAGARVARITANTDAGPFTTRLSVNNGETATLLVKQAKTINGARKQAAKLLANS